MRVLVIEDEEDIRELVRSAIESDYHAEVIEAQSGNRAIEILKNDFKFDIIVSDYLMPDGNGLAVYQFTEKQKNVPPFIICTGDELTAYPELQNIPFAAHVVKPKIIKPILMSLSVLTNVEKKENNSSSLNSNYLPIRPDTILKANVLTVDLYIKINEDKYLKVYQAQDVFTDADYLKFSSKKVDFLYLKKEDADLFLESFCEQISEAVILKGMDPDLSINISSAALTTIVEMSKELGLSASIQKLTRSAVDFTIRSIRSSPYLDSVFRSLCRDSSRNYVVSHSLAVAYAACGIAELMKWDTEINLRRFTLAAFMHDIALSNDDNARDNKSNDYTKHPQRAAELIELMSEDISFACRIIMEHHEKPDGSGFPSGLKAADISGYSALFIIAEDLVDYMLDTGESHLADYLNKRAHLFNTGVFADILSRLQRAVSKKVQAMR